jgi:hypothetical protein
MMRTLKSMWSVQRLCHLSESLGAAYGETPEPTQSRSTGWTTDSLLKLGQAMQESHLL